MISFIKHKFYEEHKRSLGKTLTYRVLIIISTLLISQNILQDWQKALTFTSLANLVNTLIYYFHERAWNHIHWGKVKHIKKEDIR